MKFKSYIILPCFMGVVLAACGSNTTEDIKNEADTLATKIEEAIEEVGPREEDPGRQDSSFVKEVVEKNRLVLLMMEKGIRVNNAKKIKNAAKSMIADHQKLGEKLEAYASGKGIYLAPLEEHRIGELDIPSPEGDQDWGREWLDRTLDLHRESFDRFEAGKHEVKDPGLQKIVSDALPILQAHVDKLSKLREEWEDMHR